VSRSRCRKGASSRCWAPTGPEVDDVEVDLELLSAERGDVTKGTIQFKGQRIDKLTPNQLVRMGVCQVMEGRHCFQHLTVEENLLTGAFTRKISRTELRASSSALPLSSAAETRRTSQPATVGGEQQMTASGAR